ncbi:hypothetical protein PF010_g5371 [Phytophthora fragariae]|uniref:Uncharacterized protein n=1 Tax=Phytophthora fragariae TaxID=53985 RepID=A0A6A3IGB2_9STRA|nr:hypothetical protein PF003_g13959 [Phytophthora fragariae]KAE8981047.1 hypothetical protein PF011_g22190 [Phytophthora fragariae]KAE9126146.1 hypothetical protein PF010_g5371 [Phytophthora fragariae]KAE9192077.1 hypothetical protein PF004_g21417 [Phytophthora fragariae]
MAMNAEKEKYFSLEEMSILLDLPVETLTRTRESAPIKQSGPEYWADWYRRTLASSEEAKRVNRDFSMACTPRVNAVQHRDADWRDVRMEVNVSRKSSSRRSDRASTRMRVR